MKVAYLKAETVLVCCPECLEPIADPRSGSHAWIPDQLKRTKDVFCRKCSKYCVIPKRKTVAL